MSKIQYEMQLFEDPEHDKFRVIYREGEPWFVLTEVCQKLGIANPRDAASRLDEDEKDAVVIADAIGRQVRKTIINESGLYSTIITSRVPGAKAFKKWVTSEVLPAIRKTGAYGNAKVPAFIKRAAENWDRVDQGYFSVISELAVMVAGRLELAGHTLADRAPDGREIRPDTSVGRCFSEWLQKNHPTVCGDYKMYRHTTPEWDGDARQYPNSMLPLFREYVDTVWWPERGPGYLKERDPKALSYLQKVLPPKAANTNRLPKRT